MDEGSARAWVNWLVRTDYRPQMVIVIMSFWSAIRAENAE